MDGTLDVPLKKKKSSHNRTGNISAIFVHAGAGFHSLTNEHTHLEACDSAARMAMRILKAGGTAVDAVEAAIKILEDKEITNAGHGSNLAIDGVVECDAMIIDHLGRSGACGATAQIKNPINLARIILNASKRPLSLRRVPPNLLVGQGATDFAWEHGIPVVPHEVLISRNSMERYIRWREDLKRVQGDRLKSDSFIFNQVGERACLADQECLKSKQQKFHMCANLNDNWVEDQPECLNISSSPSPTHGTCSKETHTTSCKLHLFKSRLKSKSSNYGSPTLASQGDDNDAPSLPFFDDCQAIKEINIPSKDSIIGSGQVCQNQYLDKLQTSSFDGVSSPSLRTSDTTVRFCQPYAQNHTNTVDSKESIEDPEDHITDTVGAIAIDMCGRIAAGSSSGGIGMKHRGRVGPAALVGIGSAVIPIDKDDEDQVCVAAVTSGTGEHMMTTMASQKCADRLYHNTRRAKGGLDTEATEEEALESFVLADFMGHPGVRGSNSVGALGVMAVKKTPYGFFLHFAHNTDSFALASMHSNEKNSKCVMSRLGAHGNLVMGGRKIRTF
ncbi:putative threonine aspartase [Golovinomyces cichoracearum]|uniref:Putative threonine aspartase n=1 Tax=Golovinomyces cichoracearum TaxID=62708 RepID=A0A420J2W2_9PEZI|nr:putative threonine aspartase [Golovinomyces cichoracearum]